MTLFYNTVTEQVIDYNQLKALFPVGFSWPPSDTGVSVDARLLMDNIHPDILQWKRFYQFSQPTVELWETVDGYTPTYNASNSHWEQIWNVRNLTQPELDSLNAFRLEQVELQRSYAYREQSDGLYFKAQRNETTMQEWKDKVTEIKALYPDPDIVEIP